MSEIQYDPACVDCRHDAGKDPAGTTWQCNWHVRAERDWLRAKLANVMVEWEHDVEVLTEERNAALTLAEQRGAAYDITWREVESLRECKDKLEGEKAPPPADAATEAVRELAAIDALLDRRDAFDGLQSRYDRILLSLRVNEQTDPKGEVAMTVRRRLLSALAAAKGGPS